MSPLPLTADERLLRDLAYPLIVQPYERDRIDAVVHEYGFTKPYPRGSYDGAAYANHLLQTWRRSNPDAAEAERLINELRERSAFTAATCRRLTCASRVWRGRGKA
jgi:hypothetical protein